MALILPRPRAEETAPEQAGEVDTTDSGGVLASESGYAGGYANPPSSSPKPSEKKEAQDFLDFRSGRRDLNPRRSPWQGEHQPRDFNELAKLEAAKGP